jgi:hypothetical protein
MRSLPTPTTIAAAAAVAALLLATGCKQKPIIEEVPASRYTTPSSSGSAAP